MPPQVSNGADGAIILAAETQQNEVARFLGRSLRDDPLPDGSLFFYVREPAVS